MEYTTKNLLDIILFRIVHSKMIVPQQIATPKC